MPYYRECPDCGANNDPGEICECRGKKASPWKAERIRRLRRIRAGIRRSQGGTQKAGRATVVDTLEYAQRIEKKGLSLVYGPGYDLVSCSALVASGAHMILFTTGRGTPYGGPTATLKISTNSKLATNKQSWIDFDAGRLLDGYPMEDLLEQLTNLVIKTANGELTKSESKGYRELAIFKTGVVQ